MQMIIIVLIQAYYHEYRNIKHVKGCLNQMFKSIHKHVHYAKCLCSRKFKGNVSSLFILIYFFPRFMNNVYQERFTLYY